MKRIVPASPLLPQAASLPAALLRIDSDWRVAAVNPRAVEITGRSLEQLVGQPVAEIFCQSEQVAEFCAVVDRGCCIVNHPVALRRAIKIKIRSPPQCFVLYFLCLRLGRAASKGPGLSEEPSDQSFAINCLDPG